MPSMIAHIAVESANLYQGNIIFISNNFIQSWINLSSPHWHFTLTRAEIHFLQMQNTFALRNTLTIQIY